MWLIKMHLTLLEATDVVVFIVNVVIVFVVNVGVVALLVVDVLVLFICGQYMFI